MHHKKEGFKIQGADRNETCTLASCEVGAILVRYEPKLLYKFQSRTPEPVFI
jgi:hypothetical protein